MIVRGEKMNSTPRKHMDIATPNRPAQRPKANFRPSRRQMIMWGLGLLLIAALIAGLHWYKQRNDLRIDPTKYQAIFLDNDQVFFGKLQGVDGNYLTLKDAYYVQGQNQNTAEAQPNNQQESTQLLKVSDTVYGPDDTMSIQSDKVLFWQNLKSDSKVSKAIDSQK